MTLPTRDLAIFDLDYTLTRRGTWGRFVWMNVRRRPWVWLPLALTAGWHQWQYKRGKIARIEVKKSMMRVAMVGKSKEVLVRMADVFAEQEVTRGLRPGAVRELAALRTKGTPIVIASAAVDIIVDPIARRLDIAHWVATNMKWEDGIAVAEFASPNCYGAAKLDRVQELLAANPELKHSDTIVTFYSDSHSDMPVFNYADIGVAVNPSKRLKDLAKTHGLEIVNWDQ